MAHDDRFAERGCRRTPLRLQGVADWIGASIRTDGTGVIVAGRRQVRGLALCRYRENQSLVPAGVDAVAPLSRRYRKREPSANRHPLDKLADGGADGAAGP